MSKRKQQTKPIKQEHIDVERAIAEGASTVKDVLDKLNKESKK